MFFTYRCGGFDHKDVSTVSNPRLCSELYRLQYALGQNRLARDLQIHGSGAQRDCDVGTFSLQLYYLMRDDVVLNNANELNLNTTKTNMCIVSHKHAVSPNLIKILFNFNNFEHK